MEDERGRALAEQLGEAATFIHLDVATASDWAAAVATAETIYGKLDILVNNAGAYVATRLQDSSEAEFDLLVAVNQRSVFLGMKIAAPALARAGSGSIVNISSSGGLRGGPGMINYRAVKWAVRGLTRSAAHDLGADGIRVNSIHPGPIQTRMIAAGNSAELNEMMVQRTLLKRLGEPIEVARATLFLASDEASYITGAEVVVDGGLSA
ncbi:MAG: SDR family oxidoreductase [Proteobacteria bacterium]|nr:SDR family oxidoreductase [Pseudomonadota bacterium]